MDVKEIRRYGAAISPVLGWLLVIYLLWDVRHYVKLAATTQRRAALLQKPSDPSHHQTTEPFVSAPYKNYPLKGYSTQLNWNLPKA